MYVESSIDGELICVDIKRFGKNFNCLFILRVLIIFNLFKFINNIFFENVLI